MRDNIISELRSEFVEEIIALKTTIKSNHEMMTKVVADLSCKIEILSDQLCNLEVPKNTDEVRSYLSKKPSNILCTTQIELDILNERLKCDKEFECLVIIEFKKINY